VDGRKIDQFSFIHTDLDGTAFVCPVRSSQLPAINAGAGNRVKECALAAVGLSDQRNAQAVFAMVEGAG